MKNCGTVVPIPGVDDRAYVSCLGASPTFDPAEQRMTAGVFVIEVDQDGVASIVRSWLPSSDPGAANSIANLVPFNDRETIAVANGDAATTTDEAYVLNVETGDQSLLFDIPWLIQNRARRLRPRQRAVVDSYQHRRGALV